MTTAHYLATYKHESGFDRPQSIRWEGHIPIPDSVPPEERTAYALRQIAQRHEQEPQELRVAYATPPSPQL